VIQLIMGADVIAHPGDAGAVNTIAILVIICFLVGIARSWELIGGPSIAITQEVAALVRHDEPGADDEPPALACRLTWAFAPCLERKLPFRRFPHVMAWCRVAVL